MNDAAPVKVGHQVDQLAPTPPAAPPRDPVITEGPPDPYDLQAQIVFLKRFQGDLIGNVGKLNIEAGSLRRAAQDFSASVAGIHGDLSHLRENTATKHELKTLTGRVTELEQAVMRLTVACSTIIDQQKQILARLPGKKPPTRSKAARRRGEAG